MFAHFTRFQKSGSGVSGEVKSFLGQFEPFLGSGFSIAQILFALRYFGLQFVFLFHKSLIIDKLAIPHLGQLIKFLLQSDQTLVLHFVNLGAVFDFRIVLFVQAFERPFQKLWQYRVFFDFFLNSQFQSFNRDAFFLVAFHFHRFSGAVVIGVFLDLSRTFDDLLFGFGRV